MLEGDVHASQHLTKTSLLLSALKPMMFVGFVFRAAAWPDAGKNYISSSVDEIMPHRPEASLLLHCF